MSVRLLMPATIVSYCTAAVVLPAHATELPVPCGTGTCGAHAATWVTDGNATHAFTANSLTVNQLTNNATLNWQSFNISSDGTVTFQQPDSSSIALNHIWQGNASQIFGALNANGRVYLINQNGILFGDGARVNVGGLVASAVNITDAALNGLARAIDTNNGSPAFERLAGDPAGLVRVERGAEIRTADGGQVFLFAPESVVNEGSIATPDGQTILAAGSKIFLATSTDANLRGLLVEVDTGGTVTNGTAGNASVTDPTQLVGNIVAERGNVTLAGLAVNQLGRVSANTSVRSGGSIRLQARDGAVANPNATPQLTAQRGGTLTLGARSITSVSLDTSDDSTQVDVNEQPRSRIEMSGARVDMLRDARIAATSGDVSVTAVADPRTIADNFATTPGASRIYMAPGARIDVSGTHVELPMERNVVRVELRGSQLADSPDQRDGALRGQTVFVDSRVTGTRADGSTWRGTPLADVAGDLATVQRGLGERNLTGGTVSLISEGDVILSEGSAIDISGGSVRFLDGFINTTQLISNGRVFDIGAADPNRTYQGIADGYVREHPRWGVSETFPGFATSGRFERGYVQGHDAGSVSIIAPRAILDGDISATTIQGPRQRLPSGVIPESSLYRPEDRLPLGGRLQVGHDSRAELVNYVTANVELRDGRVSSELTGAFDPLIDALPDDFMTTRVRPGMLQAGGVTRLAVFANDTISMGEDSTLSLAPGGEALLSGNAVEILGDIDVPAGAISLTSQYTIANQDTSAGVVLGERAQLTARGQWVNDGVLVNVPGQQLAPRLINGGSVRIAARQGGAELRSGSIIDVSAGAWQRPNGAITGGRGGSISISATETGLREAVPLVLGSDMSAYALFDGGSLSIAANEICIASADCAGGEVGSLWLAPQFFEEGGFGSFQISSNRGGLELLPNTDIRLRQSNRIIDADTSLIASGSDISTFTRIGVLDDLARRPTNLSLAASISAGNEPFTASRFESAPGLTLGANTLIGADPLATVSLQSSSWMAVDGTIDAPAGRISLTLNAALNAGEFLPRQAIWLGAGSRLDAAGTARVQVDDMGRRHGEVLDGGAVNVTAQRGYIVAQQGSTVDVSGSAVELDIPTGAATGMFEPRQIASNGGEISLTAAEGMVLSGRLSAHGGGDTAHGGHLSVGLDTFGRGALAVPLNQFPSGTRSIRLSSEQTPVAIESGIAVPDSFNGIARLDARTVAEGGFSSLHLSAGNVRPSAGSSTLLSSGEILLEGNLSLALSRSLTLDAATIVSSGGDAVLSAPYVRFGQAARSEQDVPLSAAFGGGSLQVDAGLIDVIGRSALSGFGDVSLLSRGDIRLRGVQFTGARAISGELLTAADVTLSADQIYPTTLTQFDLTIAGRPEGVLRVLPGGEGQDVLSAAGVLRINAPRIEQSGVLRAPLGTISLNGESVVLAAGSTTSTSAEGLVIPLGTTQGGFDWVYTLEDDQTLVFGDNMPVPQQRVSLDAQNIDIQEGSIIDVSGGGDLQAYEWVRGVGGTRDVLSATQPRQFAVLPGRTLPYAPHDTLEYRDSTLTPGESVYLYGVDGLPEGEYALLPARYALLPGAYLVTAVDGYTDIAPNERFTQLDGSTVIAGYRTTAETQFRDGRTSGFAVRLGEAARRDARYDLARANDFFLDRAAELDLAAPRVPRDAGVLALLAGQSLSLSGALRADAAEDGRGAALDVSADRLRITGSSTTTTQPGEVSIAASAINALGAESVLIGGTRSQAEEGLQLSVAAQTVVVEGGAQLEAPELILAGRERVALESGSVLRASSGVASSDEALLAQGDGALLRVTSGDQSRVKRLNPIGATGTLEVASGALIEANGGAVMFESTFDTISRGDLRVAGGSLNLASSQISLGEVAGSVPGLVLSGAELDGLGLEELVLTSQGSIDLYGNAAFSIERLVLEASGLRAVGNAAATVTAANGLVLSNANDRPASPPVPGGTGSLLLQAGVVELDAGEFTIQGFQTASVLATEVLRPIDEGSLIAAGQLTLTTPLLTSAAGVDYRIQAADSLRVASAGAVAAGQAQQSEPLGASLSLEGRRVDLAGRIELAGGALRATSTGAAPEDGITIGGGTVIDVSGRTTVFDGVSLHADGGNIDLVSTAGNVLIESGATLDVSSAEEGGNGGALAISARSGAAQLDGLLLGSAVEGFASGSIDIDAQAITQLTQLNQQLNTNGFFERRAFRLRGPGDISVLAGSENAVRAHEVVLAADQGRVDVTGDIDASGARGGRVQLSARDGITVSGTIDASASGANQSGGRIELNANGGPLLVVSSARLAVDSGPVTAPSGGRGGEVLYRAHRDTIGTLLDTDTTNDAVALAGAVSGARRVTLEGFERVESASGVIGPAEVTADASNPLFAAAESFTQNAGMLRSALGLAGDATFSILPGIEIFSSGDLTVAANWDLFPWRFGGAPGVLTLRSGGTLRFDGSLSDGFNGLTGNASGSPGFILPPTPGDSWSYRLVAGADLGSAHLFSVLSERDLSGSGNLLVGAPFQSEPRLIRTGTGNIDIAAGGNFELADPTSVVYTAGVNGPGIPLLLTGRLATGRRGYPSGGGDINIAAQGNIKGARSDQLVTDWLWRVGRPTGTTASATAWTVNFQSFRQNVGALGGGNVSIRSGGDIDDLSASIPSIGRQVGGQAPGVNDVEIVGGGHLDVRAGGSIHGGSYFVGLGSGRIAAGDSVGAVSTDPQSLAPILALGDAALAVTARRDLTIETIVNPTLLPQGVSQAATSTIESLNRTSVFSTYAADSQVSLLSAAGDLRLRNDVATLSQAFPTMSFVSSGDPATLSAVSLKVYPPSLRAAALRGDLFVEGSLSLFPAPRGNLELFADGDVVGSSIDALQILLSDADPEFLPSVARPAAGYFELATVLNQALVNNPNLHAAVPVHADERQPGNPDLTPARLVARSGSIILQPDNQSDTSGLFLSKPARLIAGTDIRDVTVFGQNLRESDTTSLIAGRDIVYTAQRSGFGNLTPSAREITLDGPGRLELIAGRSVDLQTSKGVTTRGNIVNPALADSGANVSVLAGIGETDGRDSDAFVTRYLELGSGHESDLIGYVAARTGEENLTREEAEQRFEQFGEYRRQLVQYVERRSGRNDLSEAQALELFRGYSESERQGLVEQVFFSELRHSGRLAAAAGDRNKDFSRGFSAVQTLFPGANPDVDAGETNPYAGDINLFFSRIYTLDDGNISLFAPGGEINAGLAAPPDSFGITKSAAELGVVAQSSGSVRAFNYNDFQVNESRVFAADGGDILVWSTRGDIDAGRGAKTAISAPAPIITFDANGNPQVTFPAALTGSGIQTLATSPDRKPGNVDLFAPRGVVNAGDAGIVAGNLTIAATAVLGADNIQVSGVAVGVPVDTGGLGTSLAGVSSVASSASNAAAAAVETNRGEEQQQASLAEAALSWLEVFVVGLGEDQCDPKDTECLKRQRSNN